MHLFLLFALWPATTTNHKQRKLHPAQRNPPRCNPTSGVNRAAGQPRSDTKDRLFRSCSIGVWPTHRASADASCKSKPRLRGRQLQIEPNLRGRQSRKSEPRTFAAAQALTFTMYDVAMTIYFGMYAATMTASMNFFWGPDSIMMLPYVSAPMDASGEFFARMTGICFGIITLGYAKLGVSKDAFIKQTMLFHVGTLPVFFLQCTNTDGAAFTPWVWYLQCTINVALAAWGYTEMSGKGKKK